MDEWDAVFHMSFMTEKNREDYLLLKLLLKGQSYVELAYMTGGVADCKIFRRIGIEYVSGI